MTHVLIYNPNLIRRGMQPFPPYVKHRLGGWLPEDPSLFKQWLGGQAKRAREHPKARKDLHPSIVRFKDFIEGEPSVFSLFQTMFDEVPNKEPYLTDPNGTKQVRNYIEMLDIFDNLLGGGPAWIHDDNDDPLGLVGFPFNAVLDWPMATSAGTSAFMRQDVNQCFKDMLDEYCSFLSSPGSTDVLDADPDGWFSTGALKAMGEVASQANPDEPISFEDAYICSPENSHYGFNSWDEFFIREFKLGVRPLPDDNTDAVIVGCCESTPYKLSTNVQLRDQFWAKGQPYSLQDMLGNYDDAQLFVGGTCYQAFLSALSYHRWHSPIDGVVKKIYHIPGTYYAENYWEGFANIDPDTNEPIPDPAAPNDSQAFISSVATRLVFIIDSSNENLGTVGIVQIGMAEVSTCQPTVEVGQRVSKGEELGMFHFGGSTHCLLFRPGINLDFVRKPDDDGTYPEGTNLPINGKLATIVA